MKDERTVKRESTFVRPGRESRAAPESGFDYDEERDYAEEEGGGEKVNHKFSQNQNRLDQLEAPQIFNGLKIQAGFFE